LIRGFAPDVAEGGGGEETVEGGELLLFDEVPPGGVLFCGGLHEATSSNGIVSKTA